jgi:hypothetical protein
LDLQLPRLKTGTLLLLEQERREMMPLVHRMVCDELAEARPVHWIDGGMMFDPSRILSLLLWRDCPSDAMDRLHVCRGFTVHQTAAIVERLAVEATEESPPERLSEGRLVVASDLARMFADPQVNQAEGRALLRKTLEDLRTTAETSDLLVVITTCRQTTPILPKALRANLEHAADDCLRTSRVVRGERRGRGSTFLLHLASIGLKVPWAGLDEGQTSLLEFRLHTHIASEVCTDLPPLIPSSDQPNGAKSAVAARMARGS